MHVNLPRFPLFWKINQQINEEFVKQLKSLEHVF